MKVGLHRICGAALILFVAGFLASANEPDTASWQRDLLAWRSQHATDLQKPDGWLSLAGLEWLQAGDNSFGSAADNKIHLPPPAPEHAGVLHLEGSTVTLNPPGLGFPP